MIFANPPLVELVAELRWVPGFAGTVNPQGGTATIQLPIGFGEESLEKFRRLIAQKGFSVSERLVPVGFPLVPFSVTQRFRKQSNEENYLYQVGLGVFSANALPPYRSWDSFRPIVREGVETLLATRHTTDRANITVLLRYLDVFTDDFTEGRKSVAFLNDVLGIKLLLPAALTEQAANLPELRAGLQLTLNLKDGLCMNIALQDGAVGTKTGIVMTTEVFTIQPVNPQLDSIMENFERAHSYIRGTFLGLTTKIRDKMNPVEA
jgi:uncharacterized protein (TIGR04255 family)